MDPIMIAAIALLLLTGAFIITKLVILTGRWLSAKLKERLSRKKDVIGISGDKLKELLSEAAEGAIEVSLEDLDMMLASMDENGEIEDIELISTEEGLDAVAANFMRQNGEMIRMTCGA